MRFLLLLSVVLSVFIPFAHAETTSAPVMEYVELQTNIGTITVKLDYDKAPISSSNFIAYVKSGFYKKTLIHRVVRFCCTRWRHGYEQLLKPPIHPFDINNGATH